MEFPKYRSHKIVEATIVRDITRLDDGSAVLVLEPMGGGPGAGPQPDIEKPVGKSFCVRLDAVTSDPRGGYWVRYPDGFESWSPAAAFEEGYDAVV